MNNDLNQLIPAFLDSPAWEDKVRLRSFQIFKGIKISVIEFNEHIHRTLLATNAGNLAPFANWKLTKSGHIEFTNIKEHALHRYGKPAGYTPNPVRTANPMNPAAMNHIHGYRDVRSAQANDRDDTGYEQENNSNY